MPGLKAQIRPARDERYGLKDASQNHIDLAGDDEGYRERISIVVVLIDVHASRIDQHACPARIDLDVMLKAKLAILGEPLDADLRASDGAVVCSQVEVLVRRAPSRVLYQVFGQVGDPDVVRLADVVELRLLAGDDIGVYLGQRWLLCLLKRRATSVAFLISQRGRRGFRVGRFHPCTDLADEETCKARRTSS